MNEDAAMSKRLVNFRNMPDDEQAEICALLEQAAIEFYLTPPNLFGLSAAALWVREEADFDRAKHLLDEYQTERARTARASFDAARAAGEVPGLWSAVRQRPAQVVGLIVLVLGVLFALSLPMLLLGR
jgi:hypothetical protein